MQFRPCIDIHNGKVKQIVGSTIRDRGDQATENFVSEEDASYFAKLYQKDGLRGGHVILLNGHDSDYYEATRQQAISALHAYPSGLQIGGGITEENAEGFLKEGASHVIVTSYVFCNGKVSYENLTKLRRAAGKEHIVLDLSCRRKEDGYYIVTDRWQKFTDEKVTIELLGRLAEDCDEFLVHGVDVEGKSGGIEEELIRLLAAYHGCPVTYAGGIRSLDDIRRIRELGGGHINVTVGSALDLFGGALAFEDIIKFVNSEE